MIRSPSKEGMCRSQGQKINFLFPCIWQVPFTGLLLSFIQISITLPLVSFLAGAGHPALPASITRGFKSAA
jgi:hypothetical protein